MPIDSTDLPAPDPGFVWCTHEGVTVPAQLPQDLLDGWPGWVPITATPAAKPTPKNEE